MAKKLFENKLVAKGKKEDIAVFRMMLSKKHDIRIGSGLDLENCKETMTETEPGIVRYYVEGTGKRDLTDILILDANAVAHFNAFDMFIERCSKETKQLYKKKKAGEVTVISLDEAVCELNIDIEYFSQDKDVRKHVLIQNGKYVTDHVGIRRNYIDENWKWTNEPVDPGCVFSI